MRKSIAGTERIARLRMERARLPSWRMTRWKEIGLPPCGMGFGRPKHPSAIQVTAVLAARFGTTEVVPFPNRCRSWFLPFLRLPCRQAPRLHRPIFRGQDRPAARGRFLQGRAFAQGLGLYARIVVRPRLTSACTFWRHGLRRRHGLRPTTRAAADDGSLYVFLRHGAELSRPWSGIQFCETRFGSGECQVPCFAGWGRIPSSGWLPALLVGRLRCRFAG